MNNSMFVEATAADALTIIGLRRRIWDTTYRGIYPDSMIDDFDWAWHKEKELSRIHLPAYSVYLIRKDGRDIGYLTMHKADEIVLQSLIFFLNISGRGSVGSHLILSKNTARNSARSLSFANVFPITSMPAHSMREWAGR